MPEIFAGRYVLVDVLGTGGMGTVWRVWDTRLQTYSAAKVLNEADAASVIRFVRESLWRIDHQHVITPTSWAAEDERVLFTMPLVAGGTVGTLIKDYGPLPEPFKIKLHDQLQQGLEAVHRLELVHRDIKPGNLLLDATGSGPPMLKLSDFGISAAIDDPRLTRTGDTVGTPYYQAPEARAGAAPDPRQDLYGVGIVAVEMLTATRPWHDSFPAMVDVVRHGSFGAFVSGLLQSDPRLRTQTASNARSDLHAVRPEQPAAYEDVEVLDHLPALPPGWTPNGPVDHQPARTAPPTAPSPAPTSATIAPPGARKPGLPAPLRTTFRVVAGLMLLLGIGLVLAALIITR